MASIFVRSAKVQAAAISVIVTTPVLALIVFGMTSHADSASPLFWLGLGMMIYGYVILASSKWDQIRRGDFSTWGLSPGRQHLRKLYYASYVCLIVGFLASSFSGLLS